VVVEDEMEAECLATADGIVQCLQMLAEEAAGLRLARTLAAIQKALQVCHEEGQEQPRLPDGPAPTFH
jgi:hypothetical protein